MNTQQLHCRFCNSPLSHIFCDLGTSPIANNYVRPQDSLKAEPFYPLTVYVCEKCLLVQLPTIHREDEIFTDDYAYFSSVSSSWLAHAKKYVEHMVADYKIDQSQLVVELASNDGYLLQYFVEKKIPVLGVEPCRNVAEAAIAKGIASVIKFFGVDTAQELVDQNKRADLIIGNNVLAHVPDLNDFVAGIKLLLKQSGIVTIEFPHLLQLMTHNQFDTIYHEHYSYYSLLSVEKVFAHHGLTIFDVAQLPTHGGSLRIYAKHTDNQSLQIQPSVADIKQTETTAGLTKMSTYEAFNAKVVVTKQKLLTKLIELKQKGKTIVGYGAPAKGNTLLNYCGIRSDFLDYTVDKSPRKQGWLLPGVRIPIFAPEKIRETKPDYVLILPWNLKKEIMAELGYIKEWGGTFLVPIPEPMELA